MFTRILDNLLVFRVYSTNNQHNIEHTTNAIKNSVHTAHHQLKILKRNWLT